MFHKVLYRSLTQKIHLIQRNLKGSDPSGLEKKIRQGFLLQTPRSIIFRSLNGGARTTIHTTRIKDTLGVISPATAILNAYKYVVGERSLCAKCARVGERCFRYASWRNVKLAWFLRKITLRGYTCYAIKHASGDRNCETRGFKRRFSSF